MRTSYHSGILNRTAVILSIKKKHISELVSLTESPIEKQFLLHVLKYFELCLAYNDFTTDYSKQVAITGFHYITESDPYKKEIWGKILGISINYSTVGFVVDDKAHLKYATINKKSEKDPIKREPTLLTTNGVNFTQMQELSIIPQYKVQIDNSNYRLDFAFLLYENNNHDLSLVKKIGIECDGYDYHSDKNQFKRDRERLRKLELDGWSIIPFSGSEINRYKYSRDEFPKEITKILSLIGFGF